VAGDSEFREEAIVDSYTPTPVSYWFRFGLRLGLFIRNVRIDRKYPAMAVPAILTLLPYLRTSYRSKVTGYPSDTMSGPVVLL
jgi:hypothetical protein